MNFIAKTIPVCVALLFQASASVAAGQAAPERATMKPEADTQAAAMPEKRQPAPAKPKPPKTRKPAPVRATLKPEPDIAAPTAKPDEPVQREKQAAPDKNSQAKSPVKRRAVTQVIEPAYRPTLVPPTPAIGQAPLQPSFGLPSAAMPAQPSGPVQLNCSAAGCVDAAGTRFNGGIGPALIDSQGRSCTRVGTTAQCF